MTTLRALFNRRPFADFTHKPEFDMLGRTYSIGYEPDLEDTLFTKPRSKMLNPANRWAVWYPLQRSKKFQTLPADHQRRILAEHGSLAKRYGAGGHAADVRLACHGLDKNDNDFIVGLLGPNLHPLVRRRAGDAQDGADGAVPRQLGTVLRRQGRVAGEAVTTDHDYDALLVVSFGGPEGPADVDSFLDNVFRGLRVPPETKAHIAKRYEHVGGVSPINAHTRAFIKALQLELDAHGPALPIYWGNRNWHPLLADTVAQMAHAGVRRALAFVTSTFSSYSGCRRYREDLFEAARGVPNAPRFDKLRVPYNHPGFIEAMSDRVGEALETLPAKQARATRSCCSRRTACRWRWRTAASTKRSSRRAAQLVGDALELERWRLVYQSNNASYGREPWLGPDIRDALREAEGRGRQSRRRRADRLRLRPHGSHHGPRRRCRGRGARARLDHGARRRPSALIPPTSRWCAS